MYFVSSFTLSARKCLIEIIAQEILKCLNFTQWCHILDKLISSSFLPPCWSMLSSNQIINLEKDVMAKGKEDFSNSNTNFLWALNKPPPPLRFFFILEKKTAIFGLKFWRPKYPLPPPPPPLVQKHSEVKITTLDVNKVLEHCHINRKWMHGFRV